MKKVAFTLLLSLFIYVSFTQQVIAQQQLSCSSRIISLVPKTLKYHNQVNNTKQLICKGGDLPSFVALDERCYLIINPSNTGDFQIKVNMIVEDKKKDGSKNTQNISLSYILSINKIRYTTFGKQQVQFDISINRVIDIQASSTSWLLKAGQQFFAQFSVKQNPKIYDRIFYQFVGLPNGLKGNQITGVVQGTVDVPPGYYSFGIRVFDLQGNSQTIQATILVHQQSSILQEEDYEDQQTLKQRLLSVQKRITQTTASIDDAKKNIQKYLELIASSRVQLSDYISQQRKLEGAEKSLSYASDWAKNNLQNMKKKFTFAETNFNNSISDVNDAKRAYQTSIFAINQKQSQIQKQQLQGDRRFQMYIAADKSYTTIRIQLDDCERKNQKIADEAIKNLKQLDRANFVQNLQNIIQNT